MHNLSDEELDRLSREAAELNQTPVSPGGWNLISSRLDQEMPVPYKDKTWYLRVISDLLLLLTLTYAGTQYPSALSKQNAIQIQSGQEIAAKKTVIPAASEEGVTSGSKNAPALQNEKSNNETRDEKVQPEKSSAGLNANAVDEEKQKKAVDFNVNKSSTVTVSRYNSPAQKEKRQKGTVDRKVKEQNALIQRIDNQAAADIVLDEKKTTDDTSSAMVLSPLAPNQNAPAKSGAEEKKSAVVTSAEKLQAPDSTIDSDLKKAIDDSKDLPLETAAKQKKKKNQVSAIDGMTKKALQIGVTWSPDFSKVGQAKPVQYGHTMGITVGYQFNKRWSVQTAVLYTKKYYTTTGDAYGKVPGYNTPDPYVKIKQVNAECYMWDIPLIIRYNWLVRSKSRAFVSTGVSSYFMKKEDLHYWYTHYNNPKYKHWINEQNSNYWFAIANVSAGFEQFITPSISIQVEPFFKFSLRDIGYGQINLKSSGIFLGLKYTPPLHLSKK